MNENFVIRETIFDVENKNLRSNNCSSVSIQLVNGRNQPQDQIGIQNKVLEYNIYK